MTKRERIAELQARIGTPNQQLGDKAQLAQLLRETQAIYDMPAGTTGTNTMDDSPWKRKGKEK